AKSSSGDRQDRPAAVGRYGRTSSMYSRALESGQLSLHPTALVCGRGGRVVRDRQSEVVVARLEGRQRRGDERVQLVGDSFGRDGHPQLGFLDARDELFAAIVRTRCPVRKVRQRATRVLGSPGEEQCVGQIDRQGDVVAVLESGGALEKVQ